MQPCKRAGKGTADIIAACIWKNNVPSVCVQILLMTTSSISCTVGWICWEECRASIESEGSSCWSRPLHSRDKVQYVLLCSCWNMLFHAAAGPHCLPMRGRRCACQLCPVPATCMYSWLRTTQSMLLRRTPFYYLTINFVGIYRLDEMEEKLNCHDIMRLSTAVFQEGSLCAAQFPLDAR